MASNTLSNICYGFRIDKVSLLRNAVPDVQTNQEGIHYEHLHGKPPALINYHELWEICHNSGSMLNSRHLEIKAPSKEKALEIVKNQRLNMMKFLNVSVPESLTLEDIQEFR